MKSGAWPQYLVAAFGIAGAIALAHGERVASSFSQQHWEDTLFFEHVRQHVKSFPDCFRYPLWPGLYRPLTTNCYYYVVGRLTPKRVEAHHLISLLTYGLNGLLLFALCRRLLGWPWALVPPLLFVSRLAHAEVVTNSVEFQVLLSVAFSLLALVLFVRGRSRGAPWPLLACVALALALLSKETALVVPAILLAYGWMFDEPAAWRAYLAPLVVVLGWAAAFATVLRGLSGHAATGFAYVDSVHSALVSYATYLLSFSNLLTGATPNRITPRHLVRLAGSPVAISAIVLLFAATAVGVVLQRRLHAGVPVRGVLLGLTFFLLGTAPFVTLEDRLYLRYGYFGHAGLAIACGALLQWLVSRVRSAAQSAARARVEPA
jgi:hypothetical protein